ncbi:tyrosine-protein kinase Wzc [Desulfocucumis palustris]|uniref:Tyrosine-protein kinase Wzc n=1 Tax=Desulfocucumis palustris TaxID=1898651 RepID=A0A2L2XIU5_9FIRM|nr:Wzz/FepE/Etk N-terminal domain-containing protein [Desulfocucumis palustris]GBF33841.1 tyrosine-protein kinase Wzc [Desulfocucumis palustris]
MSNQDTQCNIDDQSIDLRALINVVKKRFWIIALLTVAAVTVSGLFSYFFITPVYMARTVLLVTQAAEKPQATSQKDDVNSILNNAYRIPVLTMNTYVGQVRSEALMQRVINKLHLDQLGYTPRYLAGQINATAAKDSYLIEVTVSNGDPILAANIANTLSQEFMAQISEKNMEVMDRSVKFLRDQVKNIRAELAVTTDSYEKQRLQGVLNLLTEGITRTQIARSIDIGNTSLVIVSPAIAPYSPVKPNINLNMAVSLMLGLMASLALIFLFEFLDNTIKTPYDVAAHLDLPVLGLIPSADSRRMY